MRLALVGIFSDLIAVSRIGLPIKPVSLPAFPQPILLLENTPLAESLPTPVERFYRLTDGEPTSVIILAMLDARNHRLPRKNL